MSSWSHAQYSVPHPDLTSRPNGRLSTNSSPALFCLSHPAAPPTVYLTASSKLNTTINQQQGLPNQSKCPKNAPRADCMGMGSQRAWLAGVPYAGHEGLSGREGERRLVATLVYTHCKVRHRAMDTKMTRKKKKKHTQTVINGQLICFLVINEQSLSYCTPHLDCNK